MPKQLKSNFKYVWDNLLHCLLYGIFLYGCIYVLPEVLETGEPGKVTLVVIGMLLAVGGLIWFFIDFFLKWQWVTVDTQEIRARCVLFEIKSIPKTKIKRCWICQRCLMVVHRGFNVYRDCIVIDTGISRRRHQVDDGYCRKKQNYIIFRDTVENRLLLRECGIVVENP